MRREWAELVEEAGQAAVARELGVSRQAVAIACAHPSEPRTEGTVKAQGTPLRFPVAGYMFGRGTGAARAGSATSG